MEFKENVQAQFAKAGWFAGRNVKDLFEKINGFDALPLHAKDFFASYGNLIVEDCKSYESEVTVTLETDVKYANNIIRTGLPFASELYYIGYFYPDHYLIYTDENGTVYMLGDYYFKMNDDFKQGIENLLEDDWSHSLTWNPEIKEWVDGY